MAVTKVLSPHPVMPLSGPIVARLQANNLIGRVAYRLIAAMQVEAAFYQSGVFQTAPTLDITPDATSDIVPDNTTLFDLYARFEQVLKGYLQSDTFDPNYDVLSFVQDAIRQVQVEYSERYGAVDYPTGLSDEFAVLNANLSRRKSLYRTRRNPGGVSCISSTSQPDVLAPYFGNAARKFLTLWDYKRVHPADTDWLYWYTGHVDPGTLVATLTYREADGTVVTGALPIDFTDTNTCQDMSFNSKIIAIPLRMLLAAVSLTAVSACVKFQGQTNETNNIPMPVGNGTFETGTLSETGITAVGASISTANPYQGLRNLAVSGTNAANRFDYEFACTAGFTYTVTVWASVTDVVGPSPDFGAALEVYRALTFELQGTDTYTANAFPLPYSQLTVSFVAATSGTYVIRLRPEQTAFFSAIVNFDNLSVVETGLGPLADVSEEKCFIIDQTCYSQRLTMRFANRFGLTETCHLTGELRHSQEVEYSEYRTDLASQRPDNPNTAERRVFNAAETYKYTVSTGWIQEYEALNFADLFASKQVEVLVSDGVNLDFVPIRITAESADIFNTRDSQAPIVFDFEAEERILPAGGVGTGEYVQAYNPTAQAGSFTCGDLLNCTIFTDLQAQVAALEALSVPYQQGVTAQLSVTVPASVHGRTQPATLQARTNTGQLVEFDATVNPTTKDVTFTFTPAFTGLILIA